MGKEQVCGEIVEAGLIEMPTKHPRGEIGSRICRSEVLGEVGVEDFLLSPG